MDVFEREMKPYAMFFEDSWYFGADVTRSPEKEYDYYFTVSNRKPAEDVELVNARGGYFFWSTAFGMETLKSLPTRESIYSPLFEGLAY